MDMSRVLYTIRQKEEVSFVLLEVFLEHKRDRKVNRIDSEISVYL